MRNIYRPLLLWIAGATQKALVRDVCYLTIENQTPRKKLPYRVQVTPQERRRLVRFAAKLGGALDHLVTIVHPGTMRRWIREDRKGRQLVAEKRGRRRTAEAIRKLILKLAKESGWGYTRILGELRKLRILSVSRNTVKNILKAQGLDPGPQRGAGTWDEFLKLHASTLWQCDFFSKKILTIKGFRDAFVLVFLHVQTRRVFATPATAHPNQAWMVQQAEVFVQHVQQTGLGADIIMHDRDTKFAAAFDEKLKESKLRVVKTAFRSPNTVAFVERFIQTLGQEALDYFIPIGERHLNYLVSEMVVHYHEERPHQSLDNDLLPPPPKSRRKKSVRAKPGRDPTILLSEIGCKTRLGGLLRHYYRKAA